MNSEIIRNMKNTVATQTEDLLCYCCKRLYICQQGDVKLIDTLVHVQLDGVESGVFVSRNFEGANKRISKKAPGVLRNVLKARSIFKMTPRRKRRRKVLHDLSVSDFTDVSSILKSGIYTRKIVISDNIFEPPQLSPPDISFIGEDKIADDEFLNKRCQEKLKSSKLSRDEFPNANQRCAKIINHDHPLFNINGSFHNLREQNTDFKFISQEDERNKRNSNGKLLSVDSKAKHCFSEKEKTSQLKGIEKVLKKQGKYFSEHKIAVLSPEYKSKQMNYEKTNCHAIENSPASNKVDLHQYSKDTQPIVYSSPLNNVHLKTSPPTAALIKAKTQKSPRKTMLSTKTKNTGSLPSLMSISFNESDDQFITSSPVLSPKAKEPLINGIFTYV